MLQIGFNNGSLYRIADKFSPQSFQLIADSGSEIFEICWNGLDELDWLMDSVPFMKNYARRSIHIPSTEHYGNDEKTKRILDKTFELYKAIDAELVVVHPDLIDDTKLFGDYPMNFAIENMDNRKTNFKDAADMRKFFVEHNSWGMVLDVNHCFSNDPTMKLADEFIAAFHDRIKQIHVSGYAGYHEPIHKTKQEIILQAATKLDVPIIIESVVDSLDEIKKEFEYVAGFLRS